MDKHFIEETNHLIEDFDVQIIVQLENVPCDKGQARKCRKQFEGYQQTILCTLAPCELDSINEFEADLKWSDKNIFYSIQDQQIINGIFVSFSTFIVSISIADVILKNNSTSLH